MTVLQQFHRETNTFYNTDGTESTRRTRAVALDTAGTEEERSRAVELLHEFAVAHSLRISIENDALVTEYWVEV